MTKRISAGSHLHFALAATAALTVATAASAANFVWRGSTDNPVWDTTTANWTSGGTATTWVNNSSSSGSNPYFDSQGATDITVDAAGVEGFQFTAGGTHTLSGGPVTMEVLDFGSGGDLTIFNRVNIHDNNTAWGLRMIGANGTLTVADGGYLDAYFSPFNQSYQANLVVLTGGTFRATFNPNNLNNNNKPTIYFNGGKLLHTHNDWRTHITLGNSKMVIGAGGMVVLDRASSGNTYLPRPIGTDSTLPTDGGIIITNHSSYILFERRANHTYRGGLHIKGTAGSIGIEEGDSSYGSALGAAPAMPMDDIFFESPSNTVACKLVSHGSATLGATRNLRIGNGVTASISGYNSSSPFTIKGTFSCENPEHGFLDLFASGSTVTLDPGANRTNYIGRLFVATPAVIASGTTLLTGSTGVGYDNNAPLNIKSGNSLRVSGAELRTTGSGAYVTSSGTLLIDGGLVDFGSREFLHAASGASYTTVRNGGRLHLDAIRMSGGGAGGDASKSVLNLETGGVVRVTGDIFIHENLSGYKGTVNCNGGTLEWANTGSSGNCPVNAGGGARFNNTMNGLTWNVKEGGLVVSNDVVCYFRPALISGAASDGGVTKWGRSTFALFSTGSTFNGPVTIMQGPFRLGNPGAIPATCTARVNAGATFYMNTYAQSLARIEGSGTFSDVVNNGTQLLTVTSAIAPGMGADAPGTLTVSGGAINFAPAENEKIALEIDVDASGNSDRLSYPADLDLSQMTLRVNDGTILNKEHTYTIVQLGNGAILRNQFASVTGLPETWHVKYDTANGKVQLRYTSPFMLIVR